MTARVRFLIIGAGPTGLGAAVRLRDAGETAVRVVDAADGPGGLSASVVDDRGFTWDLGGHVGFSHFPAYDAVLDRALPDGWFFHEREALVWIKNRFVAYPFQYNFQALDAPEVAALLKDVRAAAAQPPGAPRDFDAWIAATFGPGLADLFLRPYNRKVWGYPLTQLSVDWMGERVAGLDVARIERNVAERRPDREWGPNNRFRFPKQGGTGAIWREVAKGLPPAWLRFNARVEAIDAERRTATLADGKTVAYDALISTLPLDRLAAITAGLSAEAAVRASRLVHSSTHVIGVGLRGPRPAALTTASWIYFPESNSPYYRVTVFSNYSPAHTPAGADYWSLLVEVCETPHRPVEAARLPERVVAALTDDGLIPAGAVVASLWHRRLEYGYPTPFVGRNAAVGGLQAELEGRGIYSRGRFGGWKYEVSNQDHSFMQGVEVVDRLLHGTPETVYR